MTPQPELLAHHYQEAGNTIAALTYWAQAGEQAAGRSSLNEAVAHFRAAVALLQNARSLQACDDIELRLRMNFGNVLMQTEGFASTGMYEHYKRARDLALALDRPRMTCCTPAAE